MSSQAKFFVMAAALLVSLCLAPQPAVAITCSEVIQDLKGCISYLQSTGGGPPPGPCCAGARNLAASATTTADRQTACNCLQTQAKNLKINNQLAQNLPQNCGISSPVPISPSVDCSTVQ